MNDVNGIERSDHPVHSDCTGRSHDTSPHAESHQLEAPEPGLNIDDTNLGLMLDVELNVLLRFGQRQLTLREVLELKSGSVIELDRRVDEPVELLLDGRVIARGEAAIVNGNYGLRVTEIVRPSNLSAVTE